MLALWVFGAIEYLSYFIVRLAYPPTQWFSGMTQWRTPRLVLDMKATGPVA